MSEKIPEINLVDSVHNPAQGDGNTTLIFKDTLGVMFLGIALILVLLIWWRSQEAQRRS